MALQTKIRKSFMIAILSNEFSKKKDTICVDCREKTDGWTNAISD
jgi:hypothetical protein